MLMIDNRDLYRLFDSYSTPAYVFDENEVAERAGKIRDILKCGSLCYSIKANPFLIPALLPVVNYFEVCSPGELSICESLSVPGEKIIYSGVHKETDDIIRALKYNAAIITAESVRQFNLICEAANDTGTCPDVILRLSSKNQFGMSLEDIGYILSHPCEQVKITGLHYFAGTGRKQNKKRIEELEMLSAATDDLRERYGCSLPLLEYGPGLPYPYFSDEDFSDTLSPLHELMPYLEKISGKCDLSVEMGRFIASSCGYYITGVCDIKRSSDNNWCIVDGGINHLNYLGQMMGMKTPVIRHYRNEDVIDDSNGITYSVCGSLCTANDVLVRSILLDDLQIKDKLVFMNAGAYSVTESMGLFLSRNLPRVILYRDGIAKSVRDDMETWRINSRVDV